MSHKPEQLISQKTLRLQDIATIRSDNTAISGLFFVSIKETQDLGKVVLTTNWEICRSFTTIQKCCCCSGVNPSRLVKLFELWTIAALKTPESFYENTCKRIVWSRFGLPQSSCLFDRHEVATKGTASSIIITKVHSRLRNLQKRSFPQGKLVRAAGLEPALLAKTDFESVASTIPPRPHISHPLVVTGAARQGYVQITRLIW